MGNKQTTLPALFILSCLTVTALPVPVQAAGNGVVVLTRDVQARQADRRTGTPDPYPTTVNTNASARIQAQTNELSDGDFAAVASGTAANPVFQSTASGGALPGMGTAQSQLPGMPGGSSAGAASGSSISGTVNQSIQRGMAPLQILTRGQ